MNTPHIFGVSYNGTLSTKRHIFFGPRAEIPDHFMEERTIDAHVFGNFPDRKVQHMEFSVPEYVEATRSNFVLGADSEVVYGSWTTTPYQAL